MLRLSSLFYRVRRRCPRWNERYCVAGRIWAAAAARQVMQSITNAATGARICSLTSPCRRATKRACSLLFPDSFITTTFNENCYTESTQLSTRRRATRMSGGDLAKIRYTAFWRVYVRRCLHRSNSCSSRCFREPWLKRCRLASRRRRHHRHRRHRRLVIVQRRPQNHFQETTLRRYSLAIHRCTVRYIDTHLYSP